MKKLSDSLQKIDDQKSKMIAMVETFTDAQQHYKATPEQWSLSQTISHLITVENGVLAYIDKKMLDPKRIEDNGISGLIRSMMLSIVLKLPFKYKAPPALPKPSNDVSITDLKQNWFSSSAKIKDLIQNLPPNFEDKQIFKHPLAGKFNLDQTLNFILEHMAHHEAQLSTIAKTIK